MPQFSHGLCEILRGRKAEDRCNDRLLQMIYFKMPTFKCDRELINRYEINKARRIHNLGAPVVQFDKYWSTDLAVPLSSHARGKIFSTVNGVPLHTAFHCHPPIYD